MRIDQLVPDTEVILDLGNLNGQTTATFLSREGEGDLRTATFAEPGPTGTFLWTAFRYKNRWAWGAGAYPLKLVQTVRDPRFAEIYDNGGQEILIGYQVEGADNDYVEWVPTEADLAAAIKRYKKRGKAIRPITRTVTYSILQIGDAE